MPSQPKLVVYTGAPEQVAQLADRFPDVDVRLTTSEAEFSAEAHDADVVFMARKYARDMVLLPQNLKWLHVGGTGVDRLRPFSDFAPDTVITHTPGISAEMIADYVICAIGMLTWDAPRMLRNQRQHTWERWPVSRIAGRTLALIGLGNIGQAVARRATAMDMHVIGIRRSPEPVPHVAQVAGPAGLHTTLRGADYVVVAVPLTAATAGMLGEPEFRAMKASAYLINVGRGNVVQERALVAALRNGRIAGAALDVFATEPLPDDHPLWAMDNVIVSPHIAAWSPDYAARAVEVFAANLARYLAGEPLRHVVDRMREY